VPDVACPSSLPTQPQTQVIALFRAGLGHGVRAALRVRLQIKLIRAAAMVPVFMAILQKNRAYSCHDAHLYDYMLQCRF